MEAESREEVSGRNNLMLAPQPGTFQDREELIKYVRDFGASQGYVVTIKKSRKDRRVILGCDRGGVYRNRRKIDESKRKRKASSRLINCPFEAIGKKEEDVWVLSVKNREHNHEALKDISEHPYSRRFTEDEVRRIKSMTEAGVKPRQVLKNLKQINPELQSTPRHLYNLKAKIRQGTLSEKSFSLWRPNRPLPVSTCTSTDGEALTQNNQPPKVPNFIGGKFIDSQGISVIDVLNPATQEVVSQVPLSTYEEFKAAVSSAKQAFPSWKNTPITTRQRIMFKLHELIRRDIDKLVTSTITEQGKTLKAAQGDVLRGLEIVEQVCGMANLQMGNFIPNTSNGIDSYSIREPLGVCAGICPFNFPAMTPLWMFPIAVSCGNTFVLKPCEKNPGASIILAGLAMEAGLPNGVLNVVHGSHDIVNYICDDDDIKALSFVSSNAAGIHINCRAASMGKRVQSNVGGKSHSIVMLDANVDATLNALVAASFTNVGMGLSTAIFVGGSMSWEGQLVEQAKSLKVNVGTDPNADLGPLITKEAKDRICSLVHNSLESGARLLLDGREITVPGFENGNFVGPTILCDITTNMDCYKEEISGPVLLCIQVESLEEAIMIVNRSRFGNGGASIFTTSGVAARKVQNEVEAGLVGINVPVSLPFSSFSDLNFYGTSGVQFYTQIKTVAQQWKDFPSGSRVIVSLSQSDRDSQSHNDPSELPVPHLSERMYMPRTSSRWNGNQITTMPLNPERGFAPVPHEIDDDEDDDSGHPNPERTMYLIATSNLGDSLNQPFERSDTMYMSAPSQSNDDDNNNSNNNLVSGSQQVDQVMPLTSERMYMASIGPRNPVVSQTSERLFLNTMMSIEDFSTQGTSQRT